LIVIRSKSHSPEFRNADVCSRRANCRNDPVSVQASPAGFNRLMTDSNSASLIHMADTPIRKAAACYAAVSSGGSGQLTPPARGPYKTGEHHVRLDAEQVEEFC
jgi:hypothetical protein